MVPVCTVWTELELLPISYFEQTEASKDRGSNGNYMSAQVKPAAEDLQEKKEGERKRRTSKSSQRLQHPWTSKLVILPLESVPH